MTTLPKPTTKEISELNCSLSQWNKASKEWWTIKCLLIMVMELLRTVSEVFILFSQNHLKKIWQNCLPTINTFYDMRQEWFPKIVTKMRGNLLFHFIVVMTQFKFTRTLTKILECGAVNLWRERNRLLKEDTWLTQISR